MKKVYNFLLILSIPVAFLLLTSEVGNSGGSQGGYTGSPGDGQNCTSCHSSTPMNMEFWILAPGMINFQYEAGVEYNIVVVGIDVNADRFGFEATAEDSQGNKVGDFTPGALGFTQLTNDNAAMTHTLAGTTPLLDTATTWSFFWTAPPSLIGNITFYAAINGANGDGTNAGDQIYLSSFTATPSGVGINDPEYAESFSVYPNPSEGILNFDIPNDRRSEPILIFDMGGKMVKRIEVGDSQVEADLSDLRHCVYFVRYAGHTERVILH